MRAVVQRVLKASVLVEGNEVGKIGPGLCIFVGISSKDTDVDADWLAKKTARLRIFPDGNDKMSQSVLDIQGEVLVISQFTLYGNCSNGCRPDFIQAARPEIAIHLYQRFLLTLEKEMGKAPQTGQFQKKMHVDVMNDGPVTLIIES